MNDFERRLEEVKKAGFFWAEITDFESRREEIEAMIPKENWIVEEAAINASMSSYKDYTSSDIQAEKKDGNVHVSLKDCYLGTFKAAHAEIAAELLKNSDISYLRVCYGGGPYICAEVSMVPYEDGDVIPGTEHEEFDEYQLGIEIHLK